MVNLSMPHLNVLSKMDLLTDYDQMQQRLSFFTENEDLSYLLRIKKQDPTTKFEKKYAKLSKELVETIQNYGLVNYIPLDIQDEESLVYLSFNIDASNGFYQFT